MLYHFCFEILWIHILSDGSLYPQCNTHDTSVTYRDSPTASQLFYLEVCSGGIESHGQSVSETVKNHCVLGNCDVAKRNNN